MHPMNRDENGNVKSFDQLHHDDMVDRLLSDDIDTVVQWVMNNEEHNLREMLRQNLRYDDLTDNELYELLDGRGLIEEEFPD